MMCSSKARTSFGTFHPPRTRHNLPSSVETIIPAAEGFENSSRFELAGGGVGGEDQLSGSNVLDFEELVGLAAHAIVGDYVGVERRGRDTVLGAC